MRAKLIPWILLSTIAYTALLLSIGLYNQKRYALQAVTVIMLIITQYHAQKELKNITGEPPSQT